MWRAGVGVEFEPLWCDGSFVDRTVTCNSQDPAFSSPHCGQSLAAEHRAGQHAGGQQQLHIGLQQCRCHHANTAAAQSEKIQTSVPGALKQKQAGTGHRTGWLMTQVAHAPWLCRAVCVCRGVLGCAEQYGACSAARVTSCMF